MVVKQKFIQYVEGKTKKNPIEGSFINDLLTAVVLDCEEAKASYQTTIGVLSESQYLDYIFQQLILQCAAIEENIRLELCSIVSLAQVNYKFDQKSLKMIQGILGTLEYLYKECEFQPRHE